MAAAEKYDWPVLFHHVAGLMSHVHTIAVDDEPSAFYTMMVYLAESSTPFLHMGWFLKTLSLDGSPLFMLNAVMILLTYIVTRVGLSPLLLYTFLHPNNHHHYDGRPYVWGFQAFICVAFMTLNYMWSVLPSQHHAEAARWSLTSEADNADCVLDALTGSDN